MVKIGNRAEQLMSGVTKMVMRRSLRLEMLRAAMMAGTAHATPEMSGTTLLPLRPKRRMILSISTITRDIYPDSSKIEMSKNKKAIWGINTSTPPMPASMPSVSSSVRLPGGRVSLSQPDSHAMPPSMRSMGA